VRARFLPNEHAQISLIAITLFLCASIVLFPIFLAMPLEKSFIIILGVILFIVAFLKTDIALIILVFSMLLSPEIGIGRIPGRDVVIRIEEIFLLSIFLGWLSKMAVNKGVGLLRSTPLNKPILIYLTINIVSTFIGVVQGRIEIKESFFYLFKYFEYFLVFFMVVNNIKSLKQVKIFVFFILLTCFLVCVYTWLNISSGIRVTAPFEGKYGEPNTLAGYLLLMMGIVGGLFLYAGSGKQRLMFLAFLAFMGVPFLFTLSRGAWVAFVPLYLVLVIFTKKRRTTLLLILVILIMFSSLIFPEAVHKRIAQTFTPGKTYTILGAHLTVDDSAASRIDSWSYAFEMWAKRPFFGYGVPAGIVTDNQYARVLREVGIIGFIIFFWIIAKIFKIAKRVYRFSEKDNFIRGLSLGFLAGFTGLLFQALTTETFIIVRIMEPFWFLTAIIVFLSFSIELKVE
jgi:O-antigen ligase